MQAVAEHAARQEPRRAAKSVGAFASGRRDPSERADLLKSDPDCHDGNPPSRAGPGQGSRARAFCSGQFLQR